MREEAEAVRTAVRESAEADEPLHSSIVTHPAAASPSGCDASIPLVRCRRRDRWTGWGRLAASRTFTLQTTFSGQRNVSPASRGGRCRSDPAAGPRFERRPRRAHYLELRRAALRPAELTWELGVWSVLSWTTIGH